MIPLADAADKGTALWEKRGGRMGIGSPNEHHVATDHDSAYAEDVTVAIASPMLWSRMETISAI